MRLQQSIKNKITYIEKLKKFEDFFIKIKLYKKQKADIIKERRKFF